MRQPHELIPPSYWDPCIQSLPSPHTYSLRSHWSLLGPDGKDSEGRTWIHWIVHQKWPVQCANLMNLFLLVIEIHAFKVLPSHRTHELFSPKRYINRPGFNQWASLPDIKLGCATVRLGDERLHHGVRLDALRSEPNGICRSSCSKGPSLPKHCVETTKACLS